MLTRRAPKYFPTFHTLRDHRRTAAKIRQALAAVDVDVAAMIICGRSSSDGVGSMLRSHRINATCCHAIIDQRHEILPQGGKLGIGKLIAQAKGKNLLPE